MEIFRGPTGLAKAAGDWDRVVASMAGAHFFHLRQWYESYLDALEDRQDDVVFCVAYDKQNNPAALLPLKQERRRVGGVKIRSLELPRHDHLHLRDILIADEHREELSLLTLTELLKDCRELQWDVLALWHVVDNSAGHSAYKNATPKLSVCNERFGYYHMPLAPWDQISQQIGKSFRSNLRSAKNRLRKMDRIRVETVRALPQLEAALEAFMEVEASGWKAKNGTAIKLDPRLKQFYTNLIRNFGRDERCEIHLLRHDQKPIGGIFTLLTGDTVYVPKVAYDEEYSRFSPVHLLYEYLFNQYEKRPNLKTLNLTSDASWFDVWKPQRSAVYNVYVFNTTVMGMAAGTAMGLVEKWRQRRALPNAA